MTRVLVTGASGVAGPYVCEALAAAGAEPIGVDIRQPVDYQAHLLAAAGTQVLESDVGDPSAVRELYARTAPAAVIHLAGALPAAINRDIPMGVRINCTSVDVLLGTAPEGTKVLVMSSKAVYGRMRGRYGHPAYAPISETCDAFPETLYERTKFVAERIVAEYRRRGVACAAVRSATQWGPGKLGDDTHTKVLHARLVEDALRGDPTVVPAGGDQVTDVIYYPDFARALALAALDGVLAEPLYNVGSGVGHTLFAFADAVREVIPQARPAIGPGLDFLGTGRAHYCVMDVSRAERDWGWTARTTMTEAIADYARRWHAHAGAGRPLTRG